MNPWPPCINRVIQLHFTESVQDKDRQPSAVPSEKCWKPVYINNKSPWTQDEDEIAIPETFKTDKMYYNYAL